MEEQGIRARSLACNTLRIEGRVWSFRMGLGRVTSIDYSHEPTQNQTQGG
jgi:hypothetical protein